MRQTGTLIAVLAFGLVIACETERAPKKDVAATTQQALPSAAPTATLERPMALRREGQGLLDSARVALIRGEAS